jgi:hypothetical protein
MTRASNAGAGRVRREGRGRAAYACRWTRSTPPPPRPFRAPWAGAARPRPRAWTAPSPPNPRFLQRDREQGRVKFGESAASARHTKEAARRGGERRRVPTAAGGGGREAGCVGAWGRRSGGESCLVWLVSCRCVRGVLEGYWDSYDKHKLRYADVVGDSAQLVKWIISSGSFPAWADQ